MTTYHIHDGKLVESGGSALGCLSMIEALLIFVAGTIISWKHMHPVFAFLTGGLCAAMYVLLFFKLYYVVIAVSVAFWGYFGYWIGHNIFSGDQIWAFTFAAVAGLFAAAEKIILRLLTRQA